MNTPIKIVLFPLLLLIFSLFLQTETVSAQENSQLWGKAGENWSPTGRLPDFSFAGYHFGEDPLPEVEVATNVLDYGAKGDGKTDCTTAFLKAIDETKQGAIFIPPGRYVISDILWIKKPNLVLRGAGPEKTVLYITRSLEEVRSNIGATTSGRPTSRYSWSGGFLWALGKINSQKIANITSESKRGTKEITIDQSVPLKKGDRIAVAIQDDRNKSLIRDLYSGDPGNISNIKKPMKTDMVSRVESVEGNKITLERPLWFDLKKEWNPTITTFEPSVSEVGIEDLAIEFPVTSYKGHFTETGLNGIAMSGVSDCWVKNVRISNCDSGVYTTGSFCTTDGLVIDSKRPPYTDSAKRTQTGHHGITVGKDCLVQNFDLRTHFIHDITVGYLKSGNVIKNGKGINLSLDHHVKAPHDNLFCNLDAGKGTELWRCGGGRNLGHHGARGNTFWCIRAQNDIPYPPENFGPDTMNFVGLTTGEKSVTKPNGFWFEVIPPEELQPADLHAAQFKHRLGKK